MSGRGIIELLAARLAGQGARRTRAPALREVLASAMPERAPVTAYEPIASRLDDPMAEGAMLAGADDMVPSMPSAIRTGPDGGSARLENNPVVPPPPEGARRLYNASTIDHDPNGYLDPHVSGWVDEIAQGAGDFDNISDITRPLVYMSDSPESWVRTIVGRKIGRHPTEVTMEDIRAHGRLNIVDADPEYDNIFQVGDYGRDGSVTTLAGERKRMWETNLYDSDEFSDMPVGPEPSDFIAREPVAVAHSLTGDDLVRFLEQQQNPTRAQPNGGPVQAGRIPSRMSVEIQQPPGQSGSRYRLELDSQKNGFITVTDDGDVWRVNNSHLDPDLRNQGHGVRLYEDLVLRAREAGARTLRSDNSVSTEAQNAWMGLQRRGYPVTRIETSDGPRFEVDLSRTAPNAGSDRNALQRALRDRMNRE